MDPIALSRQIEERYRRYLKTTFSFKDAALRASFAAELDGGHLARGPYLEATPVFARGLTPRALFTELLGRAPETGFFDALYADRPLYHHQEAAIRGAGAGRNVLVATGTGSGKTEAFLYPILAHLYREFEAGTLDDGVRALVLYPMNALANDQRERLGEIAGRLAAADSRFHFTFGQYTGETPEDAGDTWRQAQDRLAARLSGELVLRTEIRAAPPHILLTNYSMLEYLLLRPDDSPLFDDGRAHAWTFLVLDEAHQYRGFRGIEMAMLLRRLKRRLRDGGCEGIFRCLATSASLAGGEADRAAVSTFATNLFGEPFDPADVILGRTEPVPPPVSHRLAPEDYTALASALEESALEAATRLAPVAATLGTGLPEDASTAELVGHLLRCDQRAAGLRQRIVGAPAEVGSVADEVFGDLPPAERSAALAALVQLLLAAQDPGSGAPLLSARYHLFLRTLEGAFVTYWPERRVHLDRKGIGEDHVAFEVAMCRECGQHYFVGPKDVGTRLGEPVRDPGDLNFGATFFRPLDDADATEDEDDDGQRQIFHLCIRCGALGRRAPSCGHGTAIQVLKEQTPRDEDRADQQVRCSACGYTAGGRDPVREIIYGNDGPNAVIATTLYQSLPPARRKVLAFADGRQEAAFFAWYLEQSYGDLLRRRLVLAAADRLAPHAPVGLTLRELASALRNLYREGRLFPSATGDLELRHWAWCGLYRELLTEERRIGLEGVGLVRWSLAWPEWLTVPAVLLEPPWSLSEAEAWDLLAVLLESMRGDRAVDLRSDGAIPIEWADLGLVGSPLRFRLGGGAAGRRQQASVRSWDGVNQRGQVSKTQRTLYLTRLVDGLLPPGEALERAAETLRSIWGHLQRCEALVEERSRLLVAIEDGRRLNPDWYRLRRLAPDDLLHQCDTCGRLQSISVRAVCPRRGCPGHLAPVRVGDLPPNHYRELYADSWPGLLRVEEHTAQLSTERARAYQRDFKLGYIHVLSCSTTFELGVDLGDLDTIFLRNVPPEAFNYAQRVGRAGRRRGYAGFAITYCRRTPHDLYHFAEPQRMLSGSVKPPTVRIGNPKVVSRHLMATVLSVFFRTFRDRFTTVEALVGDFAQPAAAAELRRFLEQHQGQLEELLDGIIPIDSQLRRRIGLDNGSWIEQVAGSASRFALAEAEVASDFRAVTRLEEEASQARDYNTARWARDRAQTIAGEAVLSFLSRKAVIPKYGFPVDVVELDTHRTAGPGGGGDVALQRDLAQAIGEFAPTARLIANKKEWTAYGLKRVAEREWKRRLYKRCGRHNVYVEWEEGQTEPPGACRCTLHPSEYVVPQFGFVAERGRPKEPSGRPRRSFSTRPYFAGPDGVAPQAVDLPPQAPVLALLPAAPGRMVVLCEGRRGEGFYICERCGAGFRARVRQHDSPLGRQCAGTLRQLSLGHDFVTDVVQLLFRLRPDGAIDAGPFALSLASALVEGAAEVLEVPATDIRATVAHADGAAVQPIILYDNAPGGAGLVGRLEDPGVLHECLVTARNRVTGACGCDEATSCYGCLRSYGNQFAHRDLQRGPVLRYLEVILQRW